MTGLLDNHKLFLEQRLSTLHFKNTDRILALITGDTTIINEHYLEIEENWYLSFICC